VPRENMPQHGNKQKCERKVNFSIKKAYSIADMHENACLEIDT